MKTVRIGIVSDTHDLSCFNQAFPKIEKIFRGCECIVHVGDITHPRVLLALSEIAPVKAVLGNKRADSVNFPSLPRKIIFRCGEFEIGVVHGLSNDAERVLNWFLGKIGLGVLGMKIYYKRIRRFFPNDINCIIFGDLHRPICHWINEKLFFNPGTTNKERNFNGSYGILRIKDSKLFPEIVYL